MSLLYDTLYLISNAFLLPALIGVLAVFAYASLLAGEFWGEWADARFNRQLLNEFYGGPPTLERFLQFSWRGWYRRFAQAARKLHSLPALAEKDVAGIEHDMQSVVDRLGLVARIGPILGLIGTLIPLQPALAGLARGDMQAMGLNLQIGFTTTVLGLIAGGAGFVLAVIHRGMNRRTLDEFHFLLDIWLSGDAYEADFYAAKGGLLEEDQPSDAAPGRQSFGR